MQKTNTHAEQTKRNIKRRKPIKFLYGKMMNKKLKPANYMTRDYFSSARIWVWNMDVWATATAIMWEYAIEREREFLILSWKPIPEHIDMDVLLHTDEFVSIWLHAHGGLFLSSISLFYSCQLHLIHVFFRLGSNNRCEIQYQAMCNMVSHNYTSDV